MKKAIIFCNGDLSNISLIKEIISKADYIICANGGTKHAIKLHLIPHMVIGDYDSLPAMTKKKLVKHAIEWIQHPKKKDKSDSELALEIALKRGFKKIIISGVLGTRLDHLLANIFLLVKNHQNNIDLKIIEGNQEIFVVKNKITVVTNKGSSFSLVPLMGDCQGVTTNGLYYQLNNEILHFGSSRGISNIATKSKVIIALTHGVLLVFHKNVIKR